MSTTLIVFALSTGVFLLLVSIPGFEVATQWIRAKTNPKYKMPTWERIMLVSISSVVLSLAVYGLTLSMANSSPALSAQIAMVQASVLFLYNISLWMVDTFMPWKGRPIAERTAKLGPVLLLTAVPFVLPSLLWATAPACQGC